VLTFFWLEFGGALANKHLSPTTLLSIPWSLWASISDTVLSGGGPLHGWGTGRMAVEEWSFHGGKGWGSLTLDISIGNLSVLKNGCLACLWVTSVSSILTWLVGAGVAGDWDCNDEFGGLAERVEALTECLIFLHKACGKVRNFISTNSQGCQSRNTAGSCQEVIRKEQSQMSRRRALTKQKKHLSKVSLKGDIKSCRELLFLFEAIREPKCLCKMYPLIKCAQVQRYNTQSFNPLIVSFKAEPEYSWHA